MVMIFLGEKKYGFLKFRLDAYKKKNNIIINLFLINMNFLNVVQSILHPFLLFALNESVTLFFQLFFNYK